MSASYTKTITDRHFFCQYLGKGNTFSFYFVPLLIIDLSGSWSCSHGGLLFTNEEHKRVGSWHSLTQILALFMTSLILTAGHKIAVLAVVFLRFSAVLASRIINRTKTGQNKQQQKIKINAFLFYFIFWQYYQYVMVVDWTGLTPSCLQRGSSAVNKHKIKHWWIYLWRLPLIPL